MFLPTNPTATPLTEAIVISSSSVHSYSWKTWVAGSRGMTMNTEKIYGAFITLCTVYFSMFLRELPFWLSVRILASTINCIHFIIWGLFRLASGCVHYTPCFSSILHLFPVPGAIGHVSRWWSISLHERMSNESAVFLEAIPTLLLSPKLWRKAGLYCCCWRIFTWGGDAGYCLWVIFPRKGFSWGWGDWINFSRCITVWKAQSCSNTANNEYICIWSYMAYTSQLFAQFNKKLF